MKTKRIIGTVSLILALCSLSAGAEILKISETDNGDDKTKTITVSGQIPTDSKRPSGREVIVRVYEKGTEDTSMIEYMDQVTADEDGKYSFSYKKASESGDYRVEINYAASGSAPEQTVHNYLSPALNKQFFDALNEILAKKDDEGYDAPAALLEMLKSYSEQNVINIEKMNEMTAAQKDVTDIMKFMLKKDKYADIDEIAATFNEGYVLKLIKEAKSEDMSDILSDSFNLGVLKINEDILKTYKNGGKSDVDTQLAAKDYESAADFSQKFADAVVVSELSGKPWQKILTVLKANNSAIGIDFTEYDNLSEERKDKALMNFVAKVSSVKTCAGCKDAFDKAVEEAKSWSPSGGKGNGGGSSTGGSSGGSSGGSTSTVKIPGKDTTSTNEIDTTIYPETKKEVSFDDLENFDWAKEDISYLAEKGYIDGDGNGKFRPGDYITRAEFVKLLIEATRLNNAPVSDKKFSDVGEGDWFKKYVDKAIGAGVVTGVSEDLFMPHKNIKRADAAVVAMRVLKYFGQEFTKKNIVYSDVTKDYAFDAIYSAAEAGIMSGVGDNKFQPQRFLTRAEAAKVIVNIIKCKGDFVE